jgi:hypothetical protein
VAALEARQAASPSAPRTMPAMLPNLLVEERRRQERERKRRFRSRRQVVQAGGVVLRDLPVSGATLWGLQRLGLLDQDSRHDPEAVAAALHHLVEGTVHELANILQRFSPDEVPNGT